MEHRYRIYPANYAAKQCRPQKRRGWTYNPERIRIPEVSTTPQAQEQAAIDALVKIYVVIELVVFYAVVNATTVVTGVLKFGSQVIYYTIRYSFQLAYYAVQNVGQSQQVINQITPPEPKMPEPVTPPEPEQVVNTPQVVKSPQVIKSPQVLEVTSPKGFSEQVVKSTPKPEQKPKTPKVVSKSKKTDIFVVKNLKKEDKKTRQNRYVLWQKLPQSMSTKLQFRPNFKSRYKYFLS